MWVIINLKISTMSNEKSLARAAADEVTDLAKAGVDEVASLGSSFVDVVSDLFSFGSSKSEEKDDDELDCKCTKKK